MTDDVKQMQELDEKLEDAEQVPNDEQDDGEQEQKLEETKQEDVKPDPVELVKAEYQKKLDDANGRYGGAKGKADLLARASKIAKDKGYWDDEEIAQELGRNVKEIESLTSNAGADEGELLRKRGQKAAEILSAVAPALKAVGKDADEISQVMSYAILNDPDMREEFLNADEKDLAALLIERADVYAPVYKPLVEAGGDVRKVISAKDARIAELEAQLAAVKAAGVSEDDSQPKARTNLNGSGSALVNGAPRNHFYEGF